MHRKKKRQAAFKSDTLADANRIIENSPVLLFRLDARPPYPLIYVSRNVRRFGYSARQLLAAPQKYFDVTHPDDAGDMLADIAAVVSGKAAEISRERRLRAADGRYVWLDTRMRALYGRNGKVAAVEGILVDIDQRKNAESALARFSLFDAVTGLANRPAFLAKLERLFAASKELGTAFAVHYIDLDRFKDVNDVLGHSKGDALLKLVAGRLTAIQHSGVAMIARLGGDEFALLQTGVVEPSDAAALAARLVRDLAEPYALGTQVQVTASIGVAVFSADLESPEEMIKRADIALFRAKELGRNQFHFHSKDLDAATIERVMLGGDLRHALERGELELYYQPQIELRSWRIVGLEALVRWHHPKHGLLWPARFIPVAEKSGTIVPLGRWVVDEVCRQIGRWRGENLKVPLVAVNVSIEQFKYVAQFDRELSEQLARWDIEPTAIELELTESTLMETSRQHDALMERLRSLGVSIAIDDFGTGYSSLGYLSSYRVNHIKIAQEFVKNIEANPGNIAIIRAAISLARELHIAVIAEGVETRKQLDILASAGCGGAQGYLFSPPVRAARAASLIREGTIRPPAPADYAGASP